MCGIAGLFDYAAHATDASGAADDALARMVSVLRHRGPDDRGIHLAGPLGLAQARLSILDLSGGHQPIFSEYRQIAVVCNGEIYNHDELRAELQGRGHRFTTRSDTEVIVHLYEELGTGCVPRLAGMFALAVADFGRRRILLARVTLARPCGNSPDFSRRQLRPGPPIVRGPEAIGRRPRCATKHWERAIVPLTPT